MKKIFALAAITFLEGIRNRSMYGILILALFIFGLNVAVAGFFMRDIGKVTVDINLSALSFTGILLVYFVGLNLLSKDLDRKTVHLVLSKPISRYQYIYGKYLGIQGIIFISLLVIFLMSVGIIALLKTLYGGYFEGFYWVNFFVAAFFIFLKLSVLNALMCFFSALTTSSFVTLIFSVCSYVIGESIDDVVFYLKTAFDADQLAAPEILGQVIAAVSYIFPNLSIFDFSLEAAHGLFIDPQRLWLAVGYASIYIATTLFFASLVFCRREFN